MLWHYLLGIQLYTSLASLKGFHEEILSVPRRLPKVGRLKKNSTGINVADGTGPDSVSTHTGDWYWFSLRAAKPFARHGDDVKLPTLYTIPPVSPLFSQHQITLLGDIGTSCMRMTCPELLLDSEMANSWIRELTIASSPMPWPLHRPATLVVCGSISSVQIAACRWQLSQAADFDRALA